MKLYALIVAGGSGTRMKADVPKQFLLLQQKPVLMHTIEKFAKFDGEMQIVLVLPESQLSAWKTFCKAYEFNIPYHLVIGGATRPESVINGLNAIEGNGIVFIHDGVRPLVSRETLQRCLDTTLEFGNALPVMPVVESLRVVDENGNRIVDRSKYVNVQTPQVFRIEEIKAAYQLEIDPSFTDDASVLELMGMRINLVDGNRENIKITHPSDLIFAEAILSAGELKR